MPRRLNFYTTCTTYFNRSLDVILALRPSVIYPAHGKVIDDPVEKIEYYISHRNRREGQIMDVLKSRPDESLSAMDIVKVVYTASLCYSLMKMATKLFSTYESAPACETSLSDEYRRVLFWQETDAVFYSEYKQYATFDWLGILRTGEKVVEGQVSMSTLAYHFHSA